MAARLKGSVRGAIDGDASMTKLIGALVIFVFFLLIVGAKNVFGGAKRSAQKAKVLANEGAESLADDPEFEEKNKHLGLFLQAQEMLLAVGGTSPSFVNEREKLRYLHFVLGAIDQLSRTINDEQRQELWSTTTSVARAALLFGVEDAIKHLDSYGRSGDPELHRAGERGWQAMRTYILNAVGKASEDDFTKSCMELFRVVRGKETQGT